MILIALNACIHIMAHCSRLPQTTVYPFCADAYTVLDILNITDRHGSVRKSWMCIPIRNKVQYSTVHIYTQGITNKRIRSTLEIIFY